MLKALNEANRRLYNDGPKPQFVTRGTTEQPANTTAAAPLGRRRHEGHAADAAGEAAITKVCERHGLRAACGAPPFPWGAQEDRVGALGEVMRAEHEAADRSADPFETSGP